MAEQHPHHITIDAPPQEVETHAPRRSSTSAVAADPAAAASHPLCLGCKKAPIEYMTSSCKHACFCRACAMKCASGGYCKVCGNLYADLRRV